MRSDGTAPDARPRRRATIAAAVLGLLVLFAAAAAPVRVHGAPIIERILAVIAGSIVTLSDVHAAIRLGLVDPGAAVDPVAAALEQVIERSLMLIEVERYAPGEPDQEAVSARLRELHARFATDEARQRSLAAYGLTDARLAAIARDELRLERYLAQRFASGGVARDEEVLAYYREHASEFTRDDLPRPLSEVEPEIRRRLDAARRAALVDEWVRGLRRRADVTVLYLPQ
jgi:hypothetical protein